MTSVSYEANLTLNLPAGAGHQYPAVGTIQRWRKSACLGRSGPLSIDRAEVAGSGKTTALLVRVAGSYALKSPDLYVEGPAVTVLLPVVRIASTGNEALMRIDAAP